MQIPSTDWTDAGRTSTSRFFLTPDEIFVIVPDEGCFDDEATAREGLGHQHAIRQARGRAGAVVILMDPIVSQDAGARRVYRTETDPALVTCCALVGGTMFGRAIGSVFLGLSRLNVPTRLFGTLDEALAWIRALPPREGAA